MIPAKLFFQFQKIVAENFDEMSGPADKRVEALTAWLLSPNAIILTSDVLCELVWSALQSGNRVDVNRELISGRRNARKAAK